MESEAGILRERRLWRRIQAIKACIDRPLVELAASVAVSSEPEPFDRRMELEWAPIARGQSWGKAYSCAWFHLSGRVPESAHGAHVVALVDLDGEGLVVDQEGKALASITSVGTWMDRVQTGRGRSTVELFPMAEGGEELALWIDAGFNGKIVQPFGRARFRQARLAIRRDDLFSLHYDYAVLAFAVAALQGMQAKGRVRAARLRSILDEAWAALVQPSGKLGDPDTGSVAKARGILAPELYQADPGPDESGFPSFTAIGHAHLDLAWLWPLRETHRKAARTFAAALENLERYPGHVFGASQGQQFAWIKDERPELWPRIKAAVAEGRIELQGGMWVESDANLPSGEALVRQLLYGKRFFRDEFGRDMRICWLPDAFGFPASLPQILRGADIDYFMTIKLSWNERTVFPHRSFRWLGIDGSEVLVHMPPEGDYNSGGTPLCVRQACRNNPEAQVAPLALLVYGAGDGGGGPGEGHLEFVSRQRSIAGLPRVRQGSAIGFFESLERFREALPTWRGELYLEKHQGTYTTQGRQKRANRLMETSLHNLEHAQALAYMVGLPSSRVRTGELWKETLLYQFHDILPGSSVGRVYLESLARLALLRNEAEAEGLRILSELRPSESGASLVNQAPFSRQAYAKVDGSWMRAEVPAYGASRLRPAATSFSTTYEHSASREILENDLLRAVFSPNGSLVSLVDKATGFESCGAWLNRLVVYSDPWRYFNAWDLLDGYWRLPKKVLSARAIETSVDGPRVICRSTYRHGHSYIVQDAILEEGSAVLEFETLVEWHETFRMLRADFRPSFTFDKVRCDIQFGSIERSTRNDSRPERAQFEVCAHRYVDVSDGQRGLALLNDCKYGHRVKGGLVSLALLRSPLYPDPKADRGEHRFRYGLLTHAGDAFEGGVIREATLFNQSPLVVEDGPEGLPRFSVEPENVVLDTIKVAESGEGLVLRLYEAQGKDTITVISLPEGWTHVVETNLLEQELGPVDSGNLHFGPFQIRSILARREGA